ncbi:MAG TPA: AraC family transcriptional regulator [Candidatus Eremiobacteraceae bacterium]|nr:AraC family transcriptional regulator [Candidatus Eremiobacteraceae bacterium]
MSMEQRAWTRLTGTSEMQFLLRASSEGRQWSGFDAALYDTSGGLVEVPARATHNVSMHMGRTVAATCRCDGPIQRRMQTPGDVDIVPVGCTAAWEDDGPTTILSIDLNPAMVRSTAESMGINSDAVSIPPRLQVRDPKLQHIGWALRAELEAGEPNDRLYAESLGTALVAHLLRRYARVGTMVRRGLSRNQLERVMNYIGDNIGSNLSLAALAAIAGLGASTFRALFKQSVGVPVHQYVIRRRVEIAANLLSRGGARLSEVAIQTGFVDQSHMARCMRRVLGLTPASVMRLYG